MTKDEALKLALEALHGFIPYLPLNDEVQCGRYDEALTAIKEALAQPEPVCDKDPQGCWNVRCQLGKKCKNTPLQRTWVGLDEDEFVYFCAYVNHEKLSEIENVLRDKNEQQTQ